MKRYIEMRRFLLVASVACQACVCGKARTSRGAKKPFELREKKSATGGGGNPVSAVEVVVVVVVNKVSKGRPGGVLANNISKTVGEWMEQGGGAITSDLVWWANGVVWRV